MVPVAGLLVSLNGEILQSDTDAVDTGWCIV